MRKSEREREREAEQKVCGDRVSVGAGAVRAFLRACMWVCARWPACACGRAHWQAQTAPGVKARSTRQLAVATYRAGSTLAEANLGYSLLTVLAAVPVGTRALLSWHPHPHMPLQRDTAGTKRHSGGQRSHPQAFTSTAGAASSASGATAGHTPPPPWHHNCTHTYTTLEMALT